MTPFIILRIFLAITGRVQLIRSYSSAKFCSKLSGIRISSIFLIENNSYLAKKVRIKCQLRINHVQINRTHPAVIFLLENLYWTQLKNFSKLFSKNTQISLNCKNDLKVCASDGKTVMSHFKT